MILGDKDDAQAEKKANLVVADDEIHAVVLSF